MRLHELNERKSILVTEMRGLIEAAETANRDLADNERARFDAVKAELGGIESRIARAAAVAAFERLADAEPVAGERGGLDLNRYSVARAVRAMDGARLDGVEAEFHQELSRGRETRGIVIPTQVFLGETRTGQNVGDDTKGGYLVQTNVAPLADRFRPALKVESMGATVLRNLTGDLDLPNLASSGTGSWGGEDSSATRSEVGFDKGHMTPKTRMAEYVMTRRAQLQPNESIENILRKDIGFLLAQGLDAAATNGAGSTVEPTGILQSGIEKVSTAAIFSDTTADLIAALELDDVNGTRAFFTNPHVMNVARKAKDGEDRVIPLGVSFHNERVETSTQVPNNIGSGSNKSALIYGQWAELIVGYWSGVDILANPYHSDVASKGGLLLHAFLDCDVHVRHPVAFAYAEI